MTAYPIVTQKKKFLCYDTNDAASGKINVSTNGMLKPDMVFYVNVNTLVDADGNHITYEQAKEAGLNCVIVLDASSLTVGKPTIFSDQGDQSNTIWTVTNFQPSMKTRDPHPSKTLLL